MQHRPTHDPPNHADKTTADKTMQEPAGLAGQSTLALLSAPWLAQAMSQLARRLQHEPDTASTLAAITTAAVAAMSVADYAGITQARGQRVDTQAPTHPIVSTLEKLQTELQQGPCVVVLREQHIVSIPNMRAETRWPLFASRALELGVGSMLSLQLFARDNVSAALNLYAHDATAFTEDDVNFGSMFATHAGIALDGAIQRQHLGQAVVNRDLIGQAKGILMAREGITGDQAFDLLSRTSQHTNRTLVNVAHQLVTEHSPDQFSARPPLRVTNQLNASRQATAGGGASRGCGDIGGK